MQEHTDVVAWSQFIEGLEAEVGRRGETWVDRARERVWTKRSKSKGSTKIESDLTKDKERDVCRRRDVQSVRKNACCSQGEETVMQG